MSDKKIIVIEKGSVCTGDIENLRMQDFIVIESNNVDKVRIINGEDLISANDLSMSLLTGIMDGKDMSTKCMFVGELYRRLKAKEAKKTDL